MTERRLRVLFFDHERRLAGGQQCMVDLVEALAPFPVEVHVALPGPGALATALEERGATVHYVEMSRSLRRASRGSVDKSVFSVFAYTGGIVGASSRLASLIRRLRPDVVHTNSMKAHLLAVAPCRLLRVPLVWHMRDILAPGSSRRLVQVLGNATSRIVCMSRATGSQFDGSRAEKRVRVITDGIDIRRFSAPADPAWRVRLGAADGDVVIAIIGQIARWKGQDVFIEAAGDLLRRGAKARFAIVGQVLFSEREASYDRAIRDLAASAGVSDALTWTGWTDDIPAVVAALDVLVHASREPEPFGRVIVEGLAAGKPVVTTAIGAGPELVPPSAGRLVEPGNPRALADALERLITDPEERRRCGKAALEAAQHFDIARVAREVMEVYCELVPCA